MLKNILNDVKSISLTTDMWKKRNNYYYLWITGHFPDKFYNIISAVLSFRRFNGQHSVTQIKRFIANEVKKIKIEDKLESITSESGSEIKFACFQKTER